MQLLRREQHTSVLASEVRHNKIGGPPRDDVIFPHQRSWLYHPQVSLPIFGEPRCNKGGVSAASEDLGPLAIGIYRGNGCARKKKVPRPQ
jgi:hypothetical protein